ncbi:hypothetical protein MMC14_005245 [Varicellaria rhodocarpa]|nr:hypothetical protein [Varicellaria rhodocarpa]
MLNSLNILPEYTGYFKLDETTMGVSTAAILIGGCLAPGCSSFLCDRMGRRPAIFWGSIIAAASMALQSAAQNIAIFIVARVSIGFGAALANIASGTYLSETFPSAWRSWGVSMLTVVTLATSSWDLAWAWRTPSITQAIFSILCIVLLPFIPESPRWLIHQGHHDAARLSVALVASNGDIADPKLDVSFWGMIIDPVTRRRLLIGASVGSFSAIAWNLIATFYLGTEFKTAGITDTVSQLKAVSDSPHSSVMKNIALNAWCFPCALVGTQVISRWGRKSIAAVTETLLIVCLLIIGVLSKVYADDPNNPSTGLVYANVAIVFLFQGIYSVAWTPLCTLYPPEIANFSIRAHTSYFWVETEGKTLEEIDTIFDTRIRQSLSNVEAAGERAATVNAGATEKLPHERMI